MLSNEIKKSTLIQTGKVINPQNNKLSKLSELNIDNGLLVKVLVLASVGIVVIAFAGKIFAIKTCATVTKLIAHLGTDIMVASGVKWGHVYALTLPACIPWEAITKAIVGDKKRHK